MVGAVEACTAGLRPSRMIPCKFQSSDSAATWQPRRCKCVSGMGVSLRVAMFLQRSTPDHHDVVRTFQRTAAHYVCPVHALLRRRSSACSALRSTARVPVSPPRDGAVRSRQATRCAALASGTTRPPPTSRRRQKKTRSPVCRQLLEAAMGQVEITPPMV